MDIVLILILVLGVTCVIAYFYLRKRTSRQIALPIPNLSIGDVWESWLKEDSEYLDNQEIKIATLKNQLLESDLEELRAEVFRIEEECRAAESPLVLLRTAIMDALDTHYLSGLLVNLDDDTKKQIQSESDGNALEDNKLAIAFVYFLLKARILRSYSFRKHGDGGKDDWFTFYCKAANARTKQLVATLKDMADGVDFNSSLHAKLNEGYKPIMERIRQSILKLPPGTKVPIEEDGDIQRPI